MWTWWVISLIVLIACFIFACRMIISSYGFLPEDKNNLYGFKKPSGYGTNKIKTGEISDLKRKFQRLEESSSFYEIQFNKLIERLKTLESAQNHPAEKTSAAAKEKDEEDWKELYYEENERKEKLENEVDEIKRKLEYAENKLSTIDDNKSKWAELQSDFDARLTELHSLQNQIELLQRQLTAAAEREKKLEESLASDNRIRDQHDQVQKHLVRLKSENEELRRQITEMSRKEKNTEASISRLNELESKIALYEEEKAMMIAELEKVVNQNKTPPPR